MLKLIGLHIDEDDIDEVLNGEQPEGDSHEADRDDESAAFLEEEDDE